jgi:hypothetical protein
MAMPALLRRECPKALISSRPDGMTRKCVERTRRRRTSQGALGGRKIKIEALGRQLAGLNGFSRDGWREPSPSAGLWVLDQFVLE